MPSTDLARVEYEYLRTFWSAGCLDFESSNEQSQLFNAAMFFSYDPPLEFEGIWQALPAPNINVFYGD